MGITDHPLSRTVGMDDLAAELGRIVKHTLPLSDQTAGVVLPNLRNVVARAIHPDDPISRIDSLNQIVARLLTDNHDERHGEPARILFGLAAGTGGTSLTSRTDKAASHLALDPDHFRKRVRPEVVRAVAELLYRDMLRYKKRVTGGDAFADYPSWALTEDDYTGEEELSAIIWKFVYAVRAELIGARRQEKEPGYETRVATHYDMAEKYGVALQKAVENYVHLFGPSIRHGSTEYHVGSLRSYFNVDEPRLAVDAVEVRLATR